MDFKHQPVKSSQVKSVAYHPESKTLEVIFHGSAAKPGGSTYRYSDVPPEVHAKMMAAPSVGKFLHAEVKSKYKHLKIEARKL